MSQSTSVRLLGESSPTRKGDESGLDPRSTLLSVLVINAMALCYGSLTTLLICLVFSAVALGRVEPRYGLYALLAFPSSTWDIGVFSRFRLPNSRLSPQRCSCGSQGLASV